MTEFWLFFGTWQEDADGFLYFAEKYDVERMKDDIEKKLVGLVHSKNAFHFLGLNFMYNLPQL